MNTLTNEQITGTYYDAYQIAHHAEVVADRRGDQVARQKMRHVADYLWLQFLSYRQGYQDSADQSSASQRC